MPMVLYIDPNALHCEMIDGIREWVCAAAREPKYIVRFDTFINSKQTHVAYRSEMGESLQDLLERVRPDAKIQLSN